MARRKELKTVILNARYGKNNAGERCGFKPEIAEKLVQLGYARFPERVAAPAVEAAKAEAKKGAARGAKPAA